MKRSRRSLILASAAVVLAASAAALHLLVGQTARRALAEPPESMKPLRFVAVPEAPAPETWASGAIEAVAVAQDRLIVAGRSGVWESAAGREGRYLRGLPTLSVAAMDLWKGRPVVGLAQGGLFLRQSDRWLELTSGWGPLHARVIREGPGGELWAGCREGLFRITEAHVERRDEHPVRAMAFIPGGVIAGGEASLWLIEPGRSRRIETPDPWIESVAVRGHDILAVTAMGLASGSIGDRRPPALAPVGAGNDLVAAVLHGGTLYGIAPSGRVRRIDERLHVSEEPLPGEARKLMISRGDLFADTSAGLCRRVASRWELIRPLAGGELPAATSHVGALAWVGASLAVGLFDHAIVLSDGEPDRGTRWRVVEGSAAWGVSSLLAAGGTLHVASLRGAARLGEGRLVQVDGPGAAFSLARTPSGVAIGYGRGLMLPGGKLLSAFHGLPGNQVVAMASGREIFVGTPSGLGAVRDGKVAWRVTRTEGKLPHPWVTALHLAGDTLYVGTYGGGVARRRAGAEPGPGEFEPYVETRGLKVNPNCLVEAGGSLFAGTDGQGLYALRPSERTFARVRATLPSPRITALLPAPDGLLVGTDEGIVRLP